ncbi:MAG: 3-keto-5-aminohexanoate cleavage protein [Planctomycetes bacterium]|nr:3-keto-5-aminohexanoate cleavage protein [Planctomycetota bacterium]
MSDTDAPCVITAALTGVLANRAQCAAIPYTPEEIAEEARRAHDAGAAVAHIHARDPETGAMTFDPEVYRRIRVEVERRCPIIINWSTGGPGPVEGRIEHVIRPEVKPAIAALNMGSMNYAKFSSARKQFVFEMVFLNPFKDIIRFLEGMRDAGVRPELECFDAGHVGNIRPLVEMGLLKHPILFSLVMGVLGGIPATPETIMSQVRLLPPDANWQVIGLSHDQWRLVATAIVLGGNARVGLEDNFYLQEGVMARSNGELVEKAARLVRDIGRRPATVEEARTLLALDRVW